MCVCVNNAGHWGKQDGYKNACVRVCFTEYVFHLIRGAERGAGAGERVRIGERREQRDGAVKIQSILFIFL